MPFLTVADGASLHFNDWGAGKPVVFIHGWPLDADMWEYQAPVIAQAGYRAITYDRRGFGRSSQPWTGYDYDTLTSDLRALIQHLDLRDVTLVGFSMGGGEVARYMANHNGDRISKVVLLACVTPYLLKTADHPEGVDRSVFDGMIAGITKDRPGFLRGFGKLFYGVGVLKHPVSAEFLEWSASVAMLGSMKATVDCVRSWSETDFRANLLRIKVPTLIVHGDADATVPIKISSDATAELLPHATYKVYEGEPHGLFYTARDRFNEDLLAFLRG